MTDGAATPRLQDCALGLCWSLEAMMGEDCWCRHLVAMRGAADRRDGVAHERLRTAERGSMLEAIFVEGQVGISVVAWCCRNGRGLGE